MGRTLAKGYASNRDCCSKGCKEGALCNGGHQIHHVCKMELLERVEGCQTNINVGRQAAANLRSQFHNSPMCMLFLFPILILPHSCLVPPHNCKAIFF
jgi:hypothetical protein